MPRRLISGAAVAAIAFALTSTFTPAQSAPRRLPRVRFVASPGASIEVFGRYPKVDSSCRRPVQPVLRARYPGTIEIGRDRDGRLFVIGVLSFESYLEGLAEVPRKWPMEALKAQVVAARSYALATYRRPSEEGAALGYDLCATPACQVYAGMAVSHGPYGDRWRRAVRATSGQVLLYRGKPAETVYSSTSNGRTYGNEEVFGSDPLPYLRPVPERHDSSSPLSRWRVRIPLDDLRRFLRAGDDWSSGPIAAVRREGGTIRIRGAGGTEKLDADDFRSTVNYWAPCLDPDSYPTIDGGSRLPQTIPSKWFRARSSGRTLVVRGRGWGHGVGLVQWGAYGKAKQGLSYREILGHYYGGLSPQPYPQPPQIRIGIAVGLKAVRVEGAAQVNAPGGRRPDRGPWLVTGGKRLRVRQGRPPPDQIRPGWIARGPDRVRPGRPFSVRLYVPQPSVVRLVLERNGQRTALSPEVTRGAGPARVEARVPVGFAAGRYSIRAVVTDGVDIVTTNPRDLRVAEGGQSATQPTPTTPRSPNIIAAPSPQPSSPSAAVVLGRVAIALVAAAALIAAGFVLIRGRRPRRWSP